MTTDLNECNEPLHYKLVEFTCVRIAWLLLLIFCETMRYNLAGVLTSEHDYMKNCKRQT